MESDLSSDKMLRPLVYSSTEMVTLGLPILVTILLLLCVLLVLILIIRKRTEPKIPDLSDPKSDPLLDENPLFKSGITKELFYPPIEPFKGRGGMYMDIVGNSSKNLKKVPAHLDWLSPSNSEWLSINDDLYKNYYQDPRESSLSPPHPVTSSSLRRRNSYSPIRDSPRDELLFFRRGSSNSSKEECGNKRRWTGEQGIEQDDHHHHDVTRRIRRGLEGEDEEERRESETEHHFIYNSPQPERISLPSSSFISTASSLSYNHSTSNLLPYHHHSYPSSHYSPFLSYHHHSGGSGHEGGISCCDPARFDHPGCLCSLNHFPGGST